MNLPPFATPMNRDRFQQLAQKYPALRVGVVGDFCLDRYLEIDPARTETSIETGLPVNNVIKVRAQPGAAGTILNNLVAIGVGEIYPIGFCGEDGEGYELRRALAALSVVRLDGFLQTKDRCTPAYCKPLVIEPGKPPRELNRLDTKNWTPTPAAIQETIVASLMGLAPKLDAIIVLDQVDVAETGVVTRRLLQAIGQLAKDRMEQLIIADSRRGLRDWPATTFKMNAAELGALSGVAANADLDELKQSASFLARQRDRLMFVTLAERGMIAAMPDGHVEHLPSLPLRGPIDIVGAGDSVTANLTAALAAGATAREAIEVASVAASIAIHQLGTAGAASCDAISELLAAMETNGK
ncbi:MAG TPA: PfkB family carbohydrate kinase [Verrucomicrobiae bacterium]|jgi:rfaE bifunctional protein kinase chain/domain|nr:PfkB family carbohydrate kinase [Verrucomicrobiae bacterium]